MNRRDVTRALSRRYGTDAASMRPDAGWTLWPCPACRAHELPHNAPTNLDIQLRLAVPYRLRDGGIAYTAYLPLQVDHFDCEHAIYEPGYRCREGCAPNRVAAALTPPSRPQHPAAVDQSALDALRAVLHPTGSTS